MSENNNTNTNRVENARAVLRCIAGLPDLHMPTEQLAEVLALAQTTGLLPIVIGSLRQNMTREQAEMIRRSELEFKKATISRNSQSLRALPKLQSLFETDGVPFLAFKGVVQQLAIHKTPFYRPALDLDLLVPRKQFVKAGTCLEKAGMEILLPAALWWDFFLGERHYADKAEGSWSLDLHHRVTQPGLKNPKKQGAFVAQREQMTYGESRFWTLRKDDVPLVIAMNIVKHMGTQKPFAAHAFDLWTWADQSDAATFEQLFDNAKLQGLQSTLDISLRAARVLFGPIRALANERQAQDSVLPQVSDDQLALRAIDATAAPNAWTRHDILWATCSNDSLEYIPERAWLATSETSRRVQRLKKLVRAWLSERRSRQENR